MSQSEYLRGESTGASQSPSHDTVEIVDPDGNSRRFVRSDFEELYTTSDARQMRRHMRCGWLLLDEGEGQNSGQSAPWIDAAPRRSAGGVLAAQDDAQNRPQEDVTTYVLGLLKAGATGTPVE